MLSPWRWAERGGANWAERGRGKEGAGPVPRGPSAWFGPAGEVDWAAGRRGKEGAGWAAELGSLFLFLSSFLFFFSKLYSNYLNSNEF